MHNLLMALRGDGSLLVTSREYRPLVVIGVLALLLILAAVLRLWGIDVRSISHPEVYVPGIPLVPDISEPPPRHTFADTLWWHFHDEPHPIGWYMAMFAWTEVFGTSHLALRLPGVLLALGSIPLVFVVARKSFGSTVAGLAALMLTLHGFHIFWSQTARMYVAGAFLGLLATWLLLRLARTQTSRPALEACYVISVMAGVLTVELFWPLLMIHMFWAMLVLPWPSGGPGRTNGQIGFRYAPRLLQIQSLAFILSAPALTHALYRARKGAAEDPSTEFLMEYFSFGFLFAKDEFPTRVLQLDTLLAGVLVVVALLLLVTSLRAPKREAPLAIPDTRLPVWLPVGAAVAATAFMFWLGFIAHRRNEALMAFSVLPLMALSIPILATVWRKYIPRLPSARLHWLQEKTILFWLIAVAPPLVLFVASYKVSVLAPRAFLIFIPFYLILCAAGAVHLFHKRVFKWGVMGIVILIFAASVPYAARKPGSPNDYQGLAEQMQAEMQPGDLILLRNRSWVDTPLLYYIADAQFVVSDYESELNANPGARVWLVTWPYEQKPVIVDDRRYALKGYDRILTIQKLRASAELFTQSPILE